MQGLVPALLATEHSVAIGEQAMAIEAHITTLVTTLKAIILQAVAIIGAPTTDQKAFTHTKPTQNQPAIPPTLKPIQPIQDIAITIDTPIIDHIEQAPATHTGAIGLQAIPSIVLLEPIILGTIITGDLAKYLAGISREE